MICFPLDNTPYEAKDMGAYLCTRTRGVYSADGNLAVAPASTGLAVTVSPGLAWLRWSDYWGVAALLEATQTLTLDAADGSLSRIDAVVCRLNKVDNQAEIIIKKGSWSSSPTVVAPVRDSSYDEIYLATVLVGPGAVSVSASDITDQRLNEAYCGIMRDGVTGIPTAQLQEQAQELIDHLNEEIKGIEQGTEVMLKTIYGGSEDGVVARADTAAKAESAKACTGNSATASKLETSRKIGNAYFDGSKDVSLSDVGAEPAFQKNSAFNKNFGSGAGTVCQGNDTRLSNARRASNITMQLSGTTLRVTYS